MDLVSCKCHQCDAILGSVANLWLQIGKRYLSPAARSLDDDALRVSAIGSARLGDVGTLVAGCQLQDIGCSKCRATLGLRCLKSPASHVLASGQLIFRTTAITLRARSDLRRKVEPKIQNHLPLRAASPLGRAAADGHVKREESGPENDAHPPQDRHLLQLQADLEAQRQDINRIGSTGMQLVSSFETTIGGVERQMQQLSQSVDDARRESDSQRRDITSIRSDVTDLKQNRADNSLISRLDLQLQKTDQVVDELRQALSRSQSDIGHLHQQLTEAHEEVRRAKVETSNLKQELDETKQRQLAMAEASSPANDDASIQVAALWREVKQLRSELAAERARPKHPDSMPSVTSHELDILASSISRISNRASQVESLQMEFELFRTRIQRVESRFTLHEHPRNLSCPTSRSELGLGIDGGPPVVNSHSPSGTLKKRTSGGRDGPQALIKTPPKRLALSADQEDDLAETSTTSFPVNGTRHSYSSATSPPDSALLLRRNRPRAASGPEKVVQRRKRKGKG